jgi:hypothetical protein
MWREPTSTTADSTHEIRIGPIHFRAKIEAHALRRPVDSIVRNSGHTGQKAKKKLPAGSFCGFDATLATKIAQVVSGL